MGIPTGTECVKESLDQEVEPYRRSGAPGAIPTRDLPLRRRTLYATELREHTASKLTDALFLCPEMRLQRNASLADVLHPTFERFLDMP